MGKTKISLVLAFVCGSLATGEAQTPAGGEFRVNTYTTGRQFLALAAMEPDGDFVVVWTSFQDGDSYGVFGQRFAASGAPRGNEFQLNAYTTGLQILPAVAVGIGGDFVVVWQGYQDGSRRSIQGRLFDAAGSAIGGEFQVNALRRLATSSGRESAAPRMADSS